MALGEPVGSLIQTLKRIHARDYIRFVLRVTNRSCIKIIACNEFLFIVSLVNAITQQKLVEMNLCFVLF